MINTNPRIENMRKQLDKASAKAFKQLKAKDQVGGIAVTWTDAIDHEDVTIRGQASRSTAILGLLDDADTNLYRTYVQQCLTPAMAQAREQLRDIIKADTHDELIGVKLCVTSILTTGSFTIRVEGCAVS